MPMATTITLEKPMFMEAGQVYGQGRNLGRDLKNTIAILNFEVRKYNFHDKMQFMTKYKCM